METNLTLSTGNNTRENISKAINQSTNGLNRYFRIHFGTILALITSSIVIFNLFTDGKCWIAVILASAPTVTYLVFDLLDYNGNQRPAHHSPLAHPISAIATAYLAIASTYAIITTLVSLF